MKDELNEKGFVILRNFLSGETVSNLIEDLSEIKISEAVVRRQNSIYGVRNLLNSVTSIRDFAESENVKNVSESILGKGAKVVRAIYFDKTFDANWKVPWHQDLTISVKEKRETRGFTAWTRKAKIWHVQPTESVLKNMLTLRFHLDDADESNGALKVVSGSHKQRLSSAEVQKMSKTATLCRASKGDVLLMKPLIIHSSSAGTKPTRRRVLHFEISAENLPNGLDWYGS